VIYIHICLYGMVDVRYLFRTITFKHLYKAEFFLVYILQSVAKLARVTDQRPNWPTLLRVRRDLTRWYMGGFNHAARCRREIDMNEVIGLFSGTISISSQMTQCRIILLLQPITKFYLFTIELKLLYNFRRFCSKICFRTFSTVPLNSPMSLYL